MNKKILVIDDEPDIVKVLAARLREQNFTVDAAFNGKEGLEKVEYNKPDLIILDILMPNLSGTEVASKLKANKLTAGIPIIFLSALQSKDDEKQAGNIVGGQVVFAKPYDINVLISKINEMVQ